MFDYGYTTTTTTQASYADVWAACQKILADHARHPDHIDVFVLLRADAERMQIVKDCPYMVYNPFHLYGIPCHVVDSLAEGRLLGAELRLRGKRVGLVGRLAPEG